MVLMKFEFCIERMKENNNQPVIVECLLLGKMDDIHSSFYNWIARHVSHWTTKIVYEPIP